MIGHVNLQSILNHDIALAAMMAVLALCIVGMTVAIWRRM